MGKKYLDTKKGSLESSVLGVWQTAIEEGDARMDGRTKQYKSHRSKLEAARLRREERKKLNKEEVELDEKIEYVEYLFKNKRKTNCYCGTILRILIFQIGKRPSCYKGYQCHIWVPWNILIKVPLL